ncbi:MAG: hypothetical protein J1F42_11580 [Lachnospiraceae bacterium]|nr:hypothetical protein [Lachnospiraceae bacterium]
MTIGAIGAYNFQPYVYNTNTVSAASMNKLSKISDDVLDKKVDYSELTDENQNINPLKKGQTLDFQSMLEMQMQRGQNNAARIMRPAQDTQEEEELTQTSAASVTQFSQASAQAQETVASSDAAQNANANSDNGNSNISYQMQQALNAYGMFMTA